MGLSIRNLETLGSEFCGVDLSKPLSEHDRLAIGEASDRYLVIVARDQRLSNR